MAACYNIIIGCHLGLTVVYLNNAARQTIEILIVLVAQVLGKEKKCELVQPKHA